jgi:hypothetical protein
MELSMQLSETTMAVLKNYAAINSNIMISEGNTLMTIAEAKNILSSATINETFSQNLAIYDLNEFLGVMGLVDEPRLAFEEQSVTINDSTGRSKVRYYFTNPEMVTTPSQKMIDNARGMNDHEITFTLSQEDLNKLKKASSALGHTSMRISKHDNGVMLTIFDNESATGNTFDIEVPGSHLGGDRDYVLNISNLKILSGDYEVGVSSKNISHFKNTSTSIEYWIALEKSS